MLAYKYDENGYFTVAVQCQKHPLKQGEFLTPISSTQLAPPDQSSYTADQVPLFNEDVGAWVLVDSPAKRQADQALLDTQNEFGIYLFERDEEGKVVPRDSALIDSESSVVDKERQLEEAKYLMDGNIYNKAKEITKGSSLESVQAFTQAFQIRMTNAAEYVNDGLQVYYAVDGFAVLDNLNTVQKIEEYYKKVLIELDKYRQTEINTYLATKASLGF